MDGLLSKDTKIGLKNCFSPLYTHENAGEAELDDIRMEDGVRSCWRVDHVDAEEAFARCA
ncbi:MAG: hypothetical protein HUJ51_03425 [Eggerthellaceae bacterium]|nr:hypothetical protein [Eggerthellaceae bacterium]